MPYNVMQYPNGTKYAGPVDLEKATQLKEYASGNNIGSTFEIVEVPSAGGGRKRKVHIGPRGGKYVIKKGKHIYL